MFKKKIKYVVIFLVLFLVMANNIEKTDAADRKNEIDILLKESANIQEVSATIHNLNSDINITEYEEINLIHLEFPKKTNKIDLVSDEAVKKYVEIVGNMPKIEAMNIDLGNTYSSDINCEDGNLDKELNMDNKDIFNLMAWHVDEVTENGKSLEISNGKGVKIALIDSGVDYTHPILKEKINLEDAKSYVEEDSSIFDLSSHGTMIAGICSQIAPDAIITPYKVIGESSGESLWTINAIIDAVNDGNDIINMSLGTYKCTDESSERLIVNSYRRALRYAYNSNVLVVASAGNYGIDLDLYNETEHMLHLPGGVDDVNTVSAVSNQQLASYSNFGACVDYCAPGGDLVFKDGFLDLSACMYVLYPTYFDNGLEAIGIPQGYTFSYGTSLSTAIVSAGIADVLSYCKDKYRYFKISDVVKLLESGVIDLGDEGKDSLYGNGEIDIYKSLILAENLNKGTMNKIGQNKYEYQGNTMDVSYNIVCEYGNRYNVEVAITNKSKDIIHDWSIAYNSKDVINNIWNGKARQTDDYTVIKNVGYNQDINPGETIRFGYIAIKNNEIDLPNEFNLINDYLIVKAANYNVDFKVDSQWSNGYIASITITNMSDVEIRDWKIEFAYDNKIGHMWGAKILKNDENRYSIINDGITQNIMPGKSVKFSFIVSNVNSNQIPEDYALISMVEK